MRAAKSPKRPPLRQKSPKSPKSPKSKSPKRKSPKRKSPKRKSPLRIKSATKMSPQTSAHVGGGPILKKYDGKSYKQTFSVGTRDNCEKRGVGRIWRDNGCWEPFNG